MTTIRSQASVIREQIEAEKTNINLLRHDIIKAGDATSLLDAIDRDRQRHEEEMMSIASRDLAIGITPDLKRLGSTSFSFDARHLSFFGETATPNVLPRNSLGDLDLNITGPPSNKRRLDEEASDSLKIYIRQCRYHNAGLLKSELQRYRERYPGDGMWATVCLELLEEEQNHGEVFMHYAGLTLKTSAIRAIQDAKTEYRRWSNWSTITLQSIELYEHDSGHQTTSLELRDRDDLQDLERILISSCAPSLNSARGGIRSSISRHPRAPTQEVTRITQRPTEPWPFGPTISKLMRDSAEFYESVYPNGDNITPESLDNLIRHANRASLFKGVLPTLALGSDITSESFHSTRGDMGYSDRLTGMGPRVTDQCRLNALGLDHRSPGNIRATLGSFIDFFALTLIKKNCWIPILHTIRLAYLLKPMILRPCSSRLSNLLLQDVFKKVLAPLDSTNQEISTAFFNGTSPNNWRDLMKLVNPLYINIEWTSSQSERWSEIVGELCIVPIGSTWVLCLPDFDGGIIKYDPRMSTVIANMKKIIAIKGVVAELVIMDRIEKHGCPKGALDVLVDLKKVIQAKYDDQGISQELSLLKSRYREMNTAIHAKRFTSRWDRKIEVEIEMGIYEEEQIKRSRQAKERLARTRQGFLKATGQPGSAARAAQFALASRQWVSLEARNLHTTSGSRPPRFYDQTLEQWREWWLSAKEGLDLHLSSYAYNGHPTRLMTPGQKKVYATRLSGGHRPNHRPLAWYSDAPDRSQVLIRLATTRYFNESYRKHDYRIVTCKMCEGYAIGDHNVKHRCIGENVSDEDAKKIKPVASNLQYVSLVYPHDFIDHPVYGHVSWKECVECPTGIEAGFSIYLEQLGLIQEDASTIIKRDWESVRSFIPVLPAQELGPVTFKKEGSDPKHILAMAVDRYIQDRARRDSPIGGPLPPDFMYDDESAYGSQVTTITNHMSKSNNHMVLISCSHQPSYGYSSVRPASGVRQHDCPQMYGPLLVASGLCLAAHKKKHGKAGIANNCTVGKKRITNFFDLRTDIQRRLWEGAARGSDPIHDQAVGLLAWRAR